MPPRTARSTSGRAQGEENVAPSSLLPLPPPNTMEKLRIQYLVHDLNFVVDHGQLIGVELALLDDLDGKLLPVRLACRLLHHRKTATAPTAKTTRNQ